MEVRTPPVLIFFIFFSILFLKKCPAASRTIFYGAVFNLSAFWKDPPLWILLMIRATFPFSLLLPLFSVLSHHTWVEKTSVKKSHTDHSSIVSPDSNYSNYKNQDVVSIKRHVTPKKNPLIHQALLESLCAVQPNLVWSNGRIVVDHASASFHYMCWVWVKVIACPWGSISYMDLECGWGPQAAVWVALCNELQLLPTDLMSLWKCITWIPLPMPHSHPFSFVHLWTGH